MRVAEICFAVLGVVQDHDQALQISIPAGTEPGRGGQMYGSATAVVCLHGLASCIELALHVAQRVL